MEKQNDQHLESEVSENTISEEMCLENVISEEMCLENVVSEEEGLQKPISEEEHLEKLVEESDFFTCLFNEILLPIKKHTSVFEAYRKLQKICDTSHGVSQPNFLEFKIVKKPSWNKIWDIELCFHTKDRSDDCSKSDIPPSDKEILPRGYLSCHRRGTFITYALWVNGKERWFDSFELACALLERVVHAENIDEILLTI